MRISIPRGVISRLAHPTITSTARHTNVSTSITPCFTIISSLASPPSSSSSSSVPYQRSHQQSAKFHTYLRRQGRHQQQQQHHHHHHHHHHRHRSRAAAAADQPQHQHRPLPNFPYRQRHPHSPTNPTHTLAFFTTSTSPRMASTSGSVPSPAAAASTSAAPGSSQGGRSTNEERPSVARNGQEEQALQQQQQQHHQPSGSDGAEGVEPSSTTEAATTSHTAAENKGPAPPGQDTTIPALPAPGSGRDEGPPSSSMRTLEVDGKAVALDNLGPMVVGRDGTISRINNWGEMTEMERQNTLRILCKRNQVRLAALRGNDSSQGTGTTS